MTRSCLERPAPSSSGSWAWRCSMNGVAMRLFWHAPGEAPLRKELRDPVDEHAYLRAEVAIRRIQDVHRQGSRLPCREDGLELAWRHVLEHECRHLRDAQAGTRDGQMRIALVDRDPMAALDLDALAVALEDQRHHAAGARG